MPGPGRRGRGPDPGQEPPGPFPVAPRAGLAGGDHLDVQVPQLARRPDASTQPALEVATFTRYRATIECREAELEAIEADLAATSTRSPSPPPCAACPPTGASTAWAALVLQAEVCDWRRFANGAATGAFCGLVPSEYSSGDKVTPGLAHPHRQRPPAPPAHRVRLGLPSGPSLGVALRRRQEGVPAETVARAWASQVDLCRRFRPSTPASPCGAWLWPPSPAAWSATSTPRWSA